MGLFNRQKNEAGELPTNAKKNKRYVVSTIEEAEQIINELAAANKEEVDALKNAITEAENRIEEERAAASEAIKAAKYEDYKSHVLAEKAAEELLEGYRLRLERITTTEVLPKEDIATLINSLDAIFEKETNCVFDEARQIIDALETLDTKYIRFLRRIGHISNVLQLDVLNGADLYFKNKSGSRHYVSTMFSSYKHEGRALRALVFAMHREPDEYSRIMKKRSCSAAFGAKY